MVNAQQDKQRLADMAELYGLDQVPRRNSVYKPAASALTMFLNQVNSTVPWGDIEDSEVLYAAYDYAFFPDLAAIEVPDDDGFKFVKIWAFALVAVHKALGNPLAEFAFEDSAPTKEDFVIWQVTKNTVCCKRTKETIEFAFLGDMDMEWELDDVYDFGCAMRYKHMRGSKVDLSEIFKSPSVAGAWTNFNLVAATAEINSAPR